MEKFLFISCKRLLICCVFGLAADGVLTKIGIDQYSRPIIHSLVIRMQNTTNMMSFFFNEMQKTVSVWTLFPVFLYLVDGIRDEALHFVVQASNLARLLLVTNEKIFALRHNLCVF